jgi:acyl carrier protein
MKKHEFLSNLKKILEKKNLKENDNLSKSGLDSLKILELMVFNDKNFKNLNISPDKISKCKNVSDLIKLYGKNVN